MSDNEEDLSDNADNENADQYEKVIDFFLDDDVQNLESWAQTWSLLDTYTSYGGVLTEFEWTPLSVAVEFEATNCVAYILQQGGDPHQPVEVFDEIAQHWPGVTQLRLMDCLIPGRLMDCLIPGCTSLQRANLVGGRGSETSRLLRGESPQYIRKLKGFTFAMLRFNARFEHTESRLHALYVVRHLPQELREKVVRLALLWT